MRCIKGSCRRVDAGYVWWRKRVGGDILRRIRAARDYRADRNMGRQVLKQQREPVIGLTPPLETGDQVDTEDKRQPGGHHPDPGYLPEGPYRGSAQASSP